MNTTDSKQSRIDINESIGLFKGCEPHEILALALLSFIVPVFMLAAVLPIVLALVLTLVIMLVSVFIGSSLLQSIKRNKPRNFYQKKLSQILKEGINSQQFNAYTRL